MIDFFARRWLFVLVALTSFYFYPGGDPNQTSRYLLTEAIALHGRPDITATHGATVDKGELRGRYYSDKAPGVSLLAVPLYGAMRVAERVTGLDSASRPVERARVHFLSFLLAGIPSAWAAALLARALRKLGATSARRAELLACAFALGTLMFPYATALYGHTLAALLILGAFVVVLEAEVDGEPLGPRAATGLGALTAGAFVVEYPTALLSVVILAFALWRTPRAALATTCARLAAGAAGPVAVHAAFAWWAFGSPLALPYKYVVEPLFRAHTASGLFGVGTPIPAAVYGALFSPYRGLFFWCPVTALVFAGYAAWLQRGVHLRVAALSVAITLAGLLFATSYYAWDGGLATGSRHLVPVCAFFVLPLGFLVERARGWRIATFALGAASALVLVATVAVAMHLGEGDPYRGNGLYALVLPAIARGDLAIFFGDVFSTAPRGDMSGSVAALFGAPPWVTLAIPVVAWAIALVVAVRMPRDREVAA